MLLASSDDSMSIKSTPEADKAKPVESKQSPPEVSPGDETDNTVTVDTTPTPSSEKLMTQSLPPGSKVLRTTKVTTPAPVRLRRSAQAANNANNNVLKPSLNPNRASYPAAVLPTVTENRSLDNQCLGQRNSSELSLTADDRRILSNSVSGSSSTDRLSGTDGK